MVEQPFVTDAELASDYSENLEAIPEHEKERFDYVWIAFFDSSEPLCMFDVDGSENRFTEVRENSEHLVSLWWVPVDGGVSYGVRGSDCKCQRRSAVKLKPDGSREQIFYYFLADGLDRGSADNLLFISPDGDVKATDDWDFNPESYWQ